MPVQIIKSIIFGVILLMFSMLMGTQAVDGYVVPVAILAVFSGIFVLNFFGKHAWMLIFMAPPILSLLPLGKLAEIQPAYYFAILVFSYLLLTALMGYVRLTWRSLPWLDGLIFLIFFYHVYRYIQKPVGLNMMGGDFEYIGGREYFACLGATAFYIIVSCVPVTLKTLVFPLRFYVVSTVVLSVCMTLYGVSQMSASDVLESTFNTRSSIFMTVGYQMFFLLVSLASPVRIIVDVRQLAILICSALALLLSGFREQFVGMVIAFFASSIIWSQLIFCSTLALLTYGLLYYANSQAYLENLPHGVQRALSVVPGLDADTVATRDAKYSGEWRIKMWEQALDPRTGLIDDYIWGDGYGMQTSAFEQYGVRKDRGLISDEHEIFMMSGTWHNGAIALMHRLGIVGGSIVTLMLLSCMFYGLRLSRAYLGTKLQLPALYTSLTLISQVFMIYLSAGSMGKIFSYYYSIAIIKLLYCLAAEQKLLKPLFSREHYTPMVQRRIGNQSEQ